MSSIRALEPSCTECNIELALLLDSSTKSNPDGWRQIRDFASSVVRQYIISPSCVRVAVISYASSANLQIQLNRYHHSTVYRIIRITQHSITYSFNTRDKTHDNTEINIVTRC